MLQLQSKIMYHSVISGHKMAYIKLIYSNERYFWNYMRCMMRLYICKINTTGKDGRTDERVLIDSKESNFIL